MFWSRGKSRLAMSTSTLNSTSVARWAIQPASPPLATSVPDQPPNQISRLTVVDESLELLDSLKDALTGDHLLKIERNQNPIQAISSYLKANPSSELHLVAHGAPGVIQLGTQINIYNIKENFNDISNWGIDKIYLWSCETGADENFTRLLGELTGSTVFSTPDTLGEGKFLIGSGYNKLEEIISSLPFSLEQNGDDTVNTPLNMSAGQTVTGRLDFQGDDDWYKINLNSGDRYTFELKGRTFNDGTLADPYLRLHNSSGGLLTYNDDISWPQDPNSRISFTPNYDGEHFLSARSYADRSFGTFKLSASGPAFEEPNSAPVANNIELSLQEDIATSINLTATDADGDSLTYSILSYPDNGVLTQTTNSTTYSYLPASDYNGTDSFTWRANDGAADSNIATVSLSIAPVNDPTISGTKI